jgi:hypothetical protein
MIEARLERTVDLFAYPNNDPSPVSDELVRRHYRAAVQGPGAWMGALQDPHLLPRIYAPQGVMRLAMTVHRRNEPHDRAAANLGRVVVLRR